MDYPNSTMQNQPTNQPDYISPPLPSREKKEEKKRKTTTIMTIHTFTHHPTSSLPITTTACPTPHQFTSPRPPHNIPIRFQRNHGILTQTDTRTPSPPQAQYSMLPTHYDFNHPGSTVPIGRVSKASPLKFLSLLLHLLVHPSSEWDEGGMLIFAMT